MVEVPNRRCEVDADVVESISESMFVSACINGAFAFDNKLVRVNEAATSSAMSDWATTLLVQDLLFVVVAPAISESISLSGFISINSPFRLKDISFDSRDSMLTDEEELEPSSPLAANCAIPC